MDILGYLTIALFMIWCVSEIMISVISLRNRLTHSFEGRDRFSSFLMWFSILPPIWFALLIRRGPSFPNGFGSSSALFPLLGYLGCLMIVVGVTIRLLAVATLKRQFTIGVSIGQKHEIVDAGIYRILRHPAYLGLLVSLLGIGLVSENWFSLTVLAVLPLLATLYRIHVEERVLLRHFGRAYEDYASRTKRLVPGIW